MNPAAAVMIGAFMLFVLLSLSLAAKPRQPRMAVAVTELRRAVDALLADRIMCIDCVLSRRAAQLAGEVDDQLPAVVPAQVIVDGHGKCLRHITRSAVRE
jgi:hypothetical protein